ncbi:membrane protein [Chlamydia abortus]|uniref:membrane protein n=1 Tax=Chlamydia abortus TaxID=83555 RepID=UPI00052AAAC5|nr:membrane protein [Chlamydia abortus]ASD30705.1 hypothetical protein CEF07_02950 [Chlamydia abortus]QRR31339.1 hypothetical protein JS522_02920 [Chlamydia abortus]CED80613.1 conserved hypothetical membrane protein [Chlamydia abortus]CED81573.1 conserved hypothetical membrane protein [Chlamydia abortus]CEF17019.1 conserved hypothetical membrane protein [Chlamydia abortus]
MFINQYHDNTEFNQSTQNYPTLFRLGFVRDQFGLKSWTIEWIFSDDIEDLDADGVIIQVLRALPIIGVILGIGKLYSVWSTDTLEDNRKDKIILTLTGIIEICGLGIITLIMKILYNALAHILIFCLPRLVHRRNSDAEDNFREHLISQLSCEL